MSPIMKAEPTANFAWDHRLGIGHLPADIPSEQVYNGAYFTKYRFYESTALGHALTSARLEFVAQFWDGPLVDVGIGSGAFLKARGKSASGYDVNPLAIAWLRAKRRWRDPYKEPVEAASFWDSLEHIQEPRGLLAQINHWAFISMPIYRDRAHCLRSKHFRPGEHIWYFTRDGLEHYMRDLGFKCRLVTDVESRLGREEILSFAFERVCDQGLRL